MDRGKCNMNKLSMLDKTKVYYLASPYSHKQQAVMDMRYEMVNMAGAILIKEGFILIEPIAMCHHKSGKYDLPTGYEYWKTRDRTFIERSDGIIVLTLDGWKESVGVSDEIQYSYYLGKQIVYLSLDELIINEAKIGG